MTETVGSHDNLSPLREALTSQYVLERQLGRGGMGVVFAARDVRLDRTVAIKILPPQHPEDDHLRERFLREARIAAQLSHPNIVPVYRADEIAGYAYFVMALIDGESLGDRVRERGALPPTEAVRILREVAWALAVAHANGVIHRDVKPENIMMERGSNRALVTDFGIARDVRATHITEDGYVLGTAHYMSPEQIADEPLDGRSDLYALGVVAFYLLSGRLPFQVESVTALLLAHATRDPPRLLEVAPHVPERLASIVDRCLEKDPDARFATGDALAEALGDPREWINSGSGDNDPQTREVVSEGEAAAIWRRAAQLQAEASQRLERRLIKPSDLTSGEHSVGDGYRLDHVAAAAVEAGLGAEYIALALAERKGAASKTAIAGQDLTALESRLARALLGHDGVSVSASCALQGTSKEVLGAIGHVFQSHPYELKLRETVGGHPLDGGVMIFEVGGWEAAAYSSPALLFRYHLRLLGDHQLRVTLRRSHGVQPMCEVTVHGDLRRSVKQRARWTAPVAGIGAVGGGAGTFVTALLLGAAAPIAAVPAVAGAALAGGGAAWAYAAGYRASYRQVTRQLERLLKDLAAAVRGESVFGSTGAARRFSSGGQESDVTSLLSGQ
ncbi:MAG: serine/threonine-protein kinase [Gemmatimonadaceae bacterium]